MLYKFLFLIFPNCLHVVIHEVKIFNEVVLEKTTVEITYLDGNYVTIEVRKEIYDLYYNTWALMSQDM